MIFNSNLQITLNYLKNNPKSKYVLPTSAFGTISHPRYKMFDRHSSLIPFTCKSFDKECYMELDGENLYLENNFISLKNFAINLPDYTFYVEDFSKFGLGCCGDTWVSYKKRFELDLKDEQNVVLLWSNDNVNNS